MDKEKMININASLVEEPAFSSFEKDGEEVKVANFTLVKKYGGVRNTPNAGCMPKKVSL